jgi:GT2 family glycosyltransferase
MSATLAEQIAPATGAPQPPDVVVSLINHSNPDLLADCLRSLYATTRVVSFEVWVVDNATDRRGVAEMQAEFPRVRWLFNDLRLGFSANHNQVLTRARGRYYCVLNDDTVIHERALDELVAFLDARPAVGIAGPRLLNPDGSIQLSTFRFPRACAELAGVCFLPRSLHWLKNTGFDPAHFGAEPARVDWVLGACLMVRDKTLRAAGPLDSKLSPVANTEEVDWCRRIWNAGWEVAFCPAARVVHYGGQSLRPPQHGVNAIQVELMRTRLAYFAKHDGGGTAALVVLIYTATLPWNAFVLIQSLLRGRTEFARFQSELATSIAIGRTAISFGWRLFWRLEKASRARGVVSGRRCASSFPMRPAA